MPLGVDEKMISEERIMGFVEGEGCFNIAIQRYIDRKSRKTSKRWGHTNASLFKPRPSFRIGVCEADRWILDEIKETLGFGAIYLQKRSLKNTSKQDFAQYYTKSFEECLKTKDFFQRQVFYTRKGHDFHLWCQALELIKNKAHLKKEGLLEICRIRDQMNYLKTKNKRSTEEIKRILEEKPTHLMSQFDKKQAKLIHNKSFDQRVWLVPKQGNHIQGRPEQKVIGKSDGLREANTSQNNSGG